MKVIVFGSTGGIGRQVVEQALAAGHEVTAIARHPEALTIRHERLEVVRGDVLDPATVGQQVSDKEVVVSAIGVTSRAPTTLYSQGVANIIQAMASAHARRLLCISASGLDPGPLVQRWIAKPLLWAVLKSMYTDLVRMEAVVKKSGLDWTIVRPPRLTDGPRTGKYQIAVNKHLSHGSLISRADVADYIIRQFANPASYCGLAEIAY